MLFKPKWVKLLPSNLRPDKKRINQLEQLRVELGMPHEALVMVIMGAPATTRKVQRNCLDNFRINLPDASEKELLSMVLISRVQSLEQHGYFGMTEQEIDQAMKGINSFDDLCDYIIAIDVAMPEAAFKAKYGQEQSFPDFISLRQQINGILAQEEVDIKAPVENLIKLLEQTYFDLRKRHLNQDEHWLLANTYLKRYGNTTRAKQKGSKLMKFIAYKDTHSFSILEPPKSIRGLALFLVYKELEQQQAIYYSSEFSQIMEPIIKSRQRREFLNKYKSKNPQTWEESQIENDSPHSLYCFFKGLEFEQENPEEAKKILNEIESR